MLTLFAGTLPEDAGFSQVEVVETGADLNAYAKVENQAGCCSAPVGVTSYALNKRLADLLQRYDVNDYAASVRVLAVKPQ